MRITTRITWDMNSGEVLEHEHFEYEGPIAHCGGGPSSLQKQQAAESAKINAKLAEQGDKYNAREQAAYDAIAPFARQRMTEGLPYFNLLTDAQGGLTARAFAPMRQAVNQRFSGFDLPSGAREAALRAVDEAQARALDSGLLSHVQANDAARVQGAELLRNQQVMSDPLRAYGAANQGMHGIYSAQNLSSPGLGGIFGSVLGAGLGGFLGNPGLFGKPKAGGTT